MTDTIQNRLKDARREKGLTQREVADRAGISQPTYSALEGKDGTGSKHLPKIAEVLGVRVRWLYSGEGPRYKGDLELTEAEEDIIAMWRSFPDDSKRLILAQFRGLLAQDAGDAPPDR